MNDEQVRSVLDDCISRMRRTRDEIENGAMHNTLTQEELHRRVAQTARQLTTLRLSLASTIVQAGSRTVGRPPTNHAAIAARAAKVVRATAELAKRQNRRF